MKKIETMSDFNEKEVIMLKDTESFRRALSDGRLNDAEVFLKDVLLHPHDYEQYDDKWLDHRQRELFQSFYIIKDWKGAKRVVEDTKEAFSKKGRIARLEELSGLQYKDIEI